MPAPLTDFREVRAIVWRAASEPGLSERELIQRLLDTIGPAFGVDRACFNEPCDEGMQCTLEWVAPGIKPSVGARLPRMVHSQLVRPQPLEITLQSSIEALPTWARPLGAPILGALQAALDLESVAIVPCAVERGMIDGVLSFDICCGKAAPRGWSEPLLPLISEVALIVGQAIARKRAEAAHTASEQRFRALVENLGEGVARIDCDDTFIFANRASELIFGAPPGALSGRRVRDYLREDCRQQAASCARQCREGRAARAELVVARPDGAERFVEVEATPEKDEAGAVVAMVAILRDVTEQRAAEQERHKIEQVLQQSQKLESLGVLAGGIAHDFNNALMGMLAHAELVLGMLPEGHEARDSVEQIRRAALHSSGLTRRMLTFSGKATGAPEVVNLGELVDETTALMRAALSKKATLRLALAPGLAAIEADPAQVRQVAMNLLTNASEALGDAAGEIVVCTKELTLEAEALRDARIGADVPPGRFVCLEVSDTGSGIDQRHQARMFEPFFTTRFTGRGLGLSAVVGIVRTHRGAIFVDSRPGKGTRMRVCFPASDRPASVAHASAVAEYRDSLQGFTALLVDDDAAILSSVRRLLSRSGLAVIGATDGREAMRVYRQHEARISIVLLDVTMPELGGTEVLRQLRGIRPELPVILCTGHDQEDVPLSDELMRRTSFLQKPFELKRLVGVIHEMLSRGSSSST